LVKVSGDDYDTTWADLDTDGVSEGTVNLYNRVPAGGGAGDVLVKSSGTDYDASWGDVLQETSFDFLGGARLVAPGWTFIGPRTNDYNFSNNLVIYIPWLISRPTTFDAIIARVTTQGAAGAVGRAAVYAASSTFQPTGAPVIDAGTFAADSLGLKTMSISPAVTLQRGVYVLLFGVTLATTFQQRTAVAPFVTNSDTGTVLTGVDQAFRTYAGFFSGAPTNPDPYNVTGGGQTGTRMPVFGRLS
jgi:hypothetical protein